MFAFRTKVRQFALNFMKPKPSSNSKYSEKKKLQPVMHLISKFFFGDVAFTFLPLAVIAILRRSLGKFDFSFYSDPEWAFAAIIVYGLAMTRMLELKILYQKDMSENVFALMRLCILGLIAAVVSLALTQMNMAGLAVSQKCMLTLQFSVLVFGVLLLGLSHWAREQFVQRRDRLPEDLDVVSYFKFILGDFRYTRDALDELCARMEKRNALCFDGEEQKRDYTNVVRRQTRDIDNLLHDLESCLTRLRLVRTTWKPDDESAGANATPNALSATAEESTPAAD